MSRPISRNADHDVRVLNGLIAAVIDSAESYREAVDLVQDDRSRAILLECADQRDDVVVRLHKHLWERGAVPGHDLNARAGRSGQAATSLTLTAILADLERSDALCHAQFNTALNDDNVSIETIALIRECYATMRESDDQMRNLKRAGPPLAVAHPS
jgi:uncharacterized protein (TIGR02284 family)